MNKIKILIVEDDEEMCEELREILESEGYLVDVAYNAIGGLRDINIDGYNIVLLDLKLPGVSGIEVLKYIHEHVIALKVIVLTGSPMAKAEGGDFKHNYPELAYASAIMNKPFSIPEVLDKIKQLSDPERS
ncbi:MAG: response regulator [Candidatus Omnitrophota bacterium]|nr:response regulator [Candidatus Omnitrophota bacterium]